MVIVACALKAMYVSGRFTKRCETSRHSPVIGKSEFILQRFMLIAHFSSALTDPKNTCVPRRP